MGQGVWPQPLKASSRALPLEFSGKANPHGYYIDHVSWFFPLFRRGTPTDRGVVAKWIALSTEFRANQTKPRWAESWVFTKLPETKALSAG
jgi:hypothetical protein